MSIKEFIERTADAPDNIRDIRITADRKMKEKEIEFNLKDIPKEAIAAFEKYIDSNEAPIDDRKIENIAALIILSPEKAGEICKKYNDIIEKHIAYLEVLAKNKSWIIFFRLLWFLNIAKGKIDISEFLPEIQAEIKKGGAVDIQWACLKTFYPKEAKGINFSDDHARKVLPLMEIFWDAFGSSGGGARILYEGMMMLKISFPDKFQKWIKPKWPIMRRWLRDFYDAIKSESTWRPSFESFAMLASTMRILAADKIEGAADGLRIIDNEEKFQGEEPKPRPVRLSLRGV